MGYLEGNPPPRPNKKPKMNGLVGLGLIIILIIFGVSIFISAIH